MAEYTARIEGLHAFTRALAEVDKQYPNQVRKANYKVVTSIRDAARNEASTRLEKRVSRSALRANRSAREASLTLGNAAHPEALGAEFGALKYRQFRMWRGNRWKGWEGGPGYFLHPSIRKNAPKLLAAYMRELDEITDQAFPD